MTKQITESSPCFRARMTGAVYLLYFLTAVSAALVGGWPRLSLAVNLIAAALYVIVTLLFYAMFKPVSRGLSLIAALLSLAGCAMTVLGLFHPSPLNPLVFFGPYCLLIGYLIMRSFFLPRILGVLMKFAGLGWLMGVNTQRWKEQASAAGVSIRKWNPPSTADARITPPQR